MKDLLQSIKQRFQALSVTRRQVLLAGGFAAGVLLLAALTGNHGTDIHKHSQSVAPSSLPAAEFLPSRMDSVAEPSRKATLAVPGGSYGDRGNDLTRTFAEPQVTYSAQLGVVTREFAHARSTMEEILERHRGYTAKLRMVGQPNGSLLSATLRVPATEYASALAELKSVGRVDHDEESADEIVQQRGELEARLQNAQNTERRLEQVVKEKSGYAGVPAIQLQLTQLRAEIERMEAERHAFDERVVFSNIYFSLSEERVTPAESFAAQLRSASLSGLSDVLHTVAAILLFCVNYGPSLLLWAAILFLPARIFWRRSRVTLERKPA